MKMNYKGLFLICAAVILAGTCFFIIPTEVKAVIWGTENTPADEPIYVGTTCSYYRDDYGDCPLYIYDVNDTNQAYIGYFSASLQGSAGWIGPGNVTITSCLSNYRTLYAPGSSCWQIYNVDLHNSSGSIDTRRPLLDSDTNDPTPTFRYWVTNIYLNEAVVWNINNWAKGRHVSGTLNAGETTVNVGQSFAVSWNTDWGYFNGDPQLSWTGAAGEGEQGIDEDGLKIFTAGLTPGVAHFYLNNVCGPYGQAAGGIGAPRPLCLDEQEIQVNVVASFVNLNFYIKNQIGQPVSGALITINQNFGNGTTRTTDGNGFANFGVYKNTSIGYSISASSCNNMSGVANVGTSDKTVNETLTCTIGCSGSSTQSCTVSNVCGTTSGTQTRTCNTSTGTWSSWSTCSAVPPYIPPNYGSVCTTSANACGQTSSGTILCTGLCSVITPPPNTCIPTATISCTPGTVNYGGSSTVAWSCTYSSSGSVSPTGWSGLTGSQSTGALYSNQTYTLTCTGFNGTNPTANCSVTVPAPTTEIKANNSDGPITVPWNSNVDIAWSSYNASSCTVSPTTYPAPPPPPSWTGTSGSQWTGNLTKPGTYIYTATCSGNGSASDPVTINVSVPIPVIIPPVTVTPPDYCYSGPAVTVGWTYSDPAGSPQSAYQVQITNLGNFNNPIFDSSKINSSSVSYFTGQGILVFNTTYKARVRVWNSYDAVSSWVESDSFKTPSYAYPQVNFTWTANGIIENPSPPLTKPVQFTDQTVFNGNPNGRRWAWTFGDGTSSTQQNPSKTYTAEGTFYVTLTATDNANQSCSRTRGPLIIQPSIPRWREVAPK